MEKNKTKTKQTIEKWYFVPSNYYFVPSNYYFIPINYYFVPVNYDFVPTKIIIFEGTKQFRGNEIAFLNTFFFFLRPFRASYNTHCSNSAVRMHIPAYSKHLFHHRAMGKTPRMLTPTLVIFSIQRVRLHTKVYDSISARLKSKFVDCEKSKLSMQ